MKQFAAGCLLLFFGFVVGLVVAVGALALLPVGRSEPAVASVGQPEVTISFSSRYIGEQVQQVVKQSGLAASATTTLAAPDLLQISAPVDAGAFGLPLTVDATIKLRVAAQKGRISVSIAGASAGGIPVTQDTFGAALEKLRSAAEREINAEVRSGLQGSGLVVGGVRMTPSQMIVDLVSQ